MTRILVVNPNSTHEITLSLANEINSLDLLKSVSVQYYTGPKTTTPAAPPSINNNYDARISSEACLQDFMLNKPNYLKDFDGYLIACYSDHPLVSALPKIVRPGAVVMGIFQASMLYALNNATNSSKAAILTSGNDWEPLLDDAIMKFCSTNGNFPKDKFVNTLGSGIPVLELHDPKSYPQIKEKVQDLIDNGVRIVLLGCAGLSSLNSTMQKDFPFVKFVDSVKVGVYLLVAYIQIGKI